MKKLKKSTQRSQSKERKKQTEKVKFSKKDIKEIIDRVLMSVAISCVTQILKKGFPCGPTFGGQPIETLPSRFIKPKSKAPQSKRLSQNLLN